MNRNHSIIYIFLSFALVFSSCIDKIEHIDIKHQITSEHIVFGGVSANDIIITRSGETPSSTVSQKTLTAESGSVSLPLLVNVEQGIKHCTPETRAAITTEIDAITQLDAWATKNTYTDANKTQIASRTLFFTGNDGNATTGALFTKEAGDSDLNGDGKIDDIFYPDGNGPYLWEKNASSVSEFQFVTVSPANCGFKANINEITKAVTFDYAIPRAAANQKDILVAVPAPVPVNYGMSVPLDYKHVMAAVNVKIGTNMPSGIIKSIKFTGVYTNASYYPNSNEWTNRTIVDGGEFSVTLPEGGLAVGPESLGTTITTEETSFMMIPQQISSDAWIVVEFHDNETGKDVVLRASIQGDVWEQNTTTTYAINISGNYNISIEPLDKILDSHYIIAKVQISAVNLGDWTVGVSSALRSGEVDSENYEVIHEDQNLVTILPEELVNPMAKQGYWTDKLLKWVQDNNKSGHYEETTTSARGIYYCDGEGDMSNKIFYIFIPENTSGKVREISVMVLSKTNTVLNKSIMLEQYPVAWIDPDKSGNSDNYVGGEFLIEGGQVPWGFSWNGVEEKYRLTQGSGNPWGQIKNTLLPAMDKAGINYNNFPNYIWMATQHSDHKEEFVLIIDYSSIISTIKVATSLSDGNQNTWELYSFNPDDQLSGTGEVAGLGLIAALKEVISGLGNVERVTQGDLGLVNTTDNYAALKALQRNRFNIYIDEANKIYLPVIKQADANWYLPAKNQFDNFLSRSSWGQYFTWNDIYWTSSIYEDATSSNNDTGKAYMFNIGQTAPDLRTNTHYAMAIRRMTYTSGVVIPPSDEVIKPGEDGPVIGDKPDKDEGEDPTVPTE